jgi:hypothetical protein
VPPGLVMGIGFVTARAGPSKVARKPSPVGFLASVTRQFLAHDRVAGVQDIAPGHLRRDNEYVVYVCWADSRYDTATWKEDVVAYHRRKDAVTRGWHG